MTFVSFFGGYNKDVTEEASPCPQERVCKSLSNHCIDKVLFILILDTTGHRPAEDGSFPVTGRSIRHPYGGRQKQKVSGTGQSQYS